MPDELSFPTIANRSDSCLYEGLLRKIRLQRGLHRYYELRTRRTANLVKSLNIILPAHIVFLVFSDVAALSSHLHWLTPQLIGGLIGATGFILFVTSVLTEVFKGDQRHLDHRQAIENLAELLQEIEISDVRDKSPEMRRDLFENFNKRYRQITITSPKFTDKQFDRAVAYLLRSKARKLARKENPFANWLMLDKLAKRKVAEVLADKSDPLYGFPNINEDGDCGEER
jgi:hypothetical protein